LRRRVAGFYSAVDSVEQLGRIKAIRDIKSDIPMQMIKQSVEIPL